MYQNFGLFVGGAWGGGAGGRSAPVVSPVTEQPLGEVPHAAAADTEAAIDAAARGLVAWRSRTAFERADALHAIADEMIRRKDEAARMISSETGKPLVQAEREWGLSSDQFRWYAEEARRIYGRIVESRVPGGRFEVTREPIMASPAVRKVSLTGSTRVGQQMIRDAAATMKKATMELGGNAPLIVYDDADLETVLNVSVPTKFANAGQVCVAPDRFFVHESLHDTFVDGFA